MAPQENAYDLVIVGGGPAGLTAARYCLHARLNAAIIAPELGSTVNYLFALRDQSPTNVVWGAPLVEQFEQRIVAAQGLPHLAQEVTTVSRTDTGQFRVQLRDGRELHTRGVILATGAAPQRLYVEGEKEYWGRGVSFSAVSHAPYFAGRDVAIVGGHRRTLIAALELASIARQIYLIAALPQAMAQLPETARVLALPNITPFIDWEVQAILGDEFVTSISLVGANGETRELAVDGVFVQMALIPNNEMIREMVDVGMKMTAEGNVVINQRCETSVPGLFAAGDVSDIHTEQVLAAMGEGAKAALSAWEYLITHP